VNVGGRGCPTRSARISSSGSSRLRSVIRAIGRVASRPSWPARSMAASASPSTASGGVLRHVGLNTRSKRPALIARHHHPYERRPDPPPAERQIDATTLGKKVQLDCVFVGRLAGTKAPSGNTPRSTSPRRIAGPSFTPQSATRDPATHASSCTASPPSSPTRAGSCTRSPPTTAPSSAPERSAPPSKASAPASASSPPARPTATVASNASNSPSSRNAGDPRSRAHSYSKHGTAQELADYLNEHNYDRAHTGRLTQGRVPADIVSGARESSTLR
jgi:hypothetical protein